MNENKNKNPKFNSSGYRDMTAFKAIGNADREKRKFSKMQKVYVCSPLRGDVEKNTANAIRYCRFALKRNRFPIAPHIWFPRFLNDDIPAERELAIKMGLWLLTQCGEVWVFGSRISEGMAAEINAAKKQGKKIKYIKVEGGKTSRAN